MAFNTMALAALLEAAKTDGGFEVVMCPPSAVCVAYRLPLTTVDGDLPGEVEVRILLPLCGSADVLMAPTTIELRVIGGPLAARVVSEDREHFRAGALAVIEAIVLSCPGGPARA